MNEHDARWGYLPNSPLEFFGLDLGYDIEQLKRVYGMFVRKFKPDKFPDEFKKIRAAYEELERNLRYERTEPYEEVRRQFDESQASHVRQSDEATPAPVPSTKEDALRQLEEGNPERVFKSIVARSSKTPIDYYFLAVLCDVVDDSSKSFRGWLMEGLSLYPRDQGLTRLLTEYAKSNQLSPAELSHLLMQMAQTTPREAYFFVTEPFWHRLLKMSEWDSFVSALRKCEKRFDTVILHTKAAFYVGLLRQAMWKAPIEWLQETCRWLEQDSAGLHGALDMEYEVYSSLLALRKHEEDIRKLGRFGPLIIETAKCYCEEDEATSFLAMLECQTEIANHPSDFLDAFRFELTGSPLNYRGWLWISSSVLSQLGGGEAVHGRVMSIEQTVYQCMKEIDAVFPKRFNYWLTLRKLVCLIAFGIASVIALVLLTGATTLACLGVLGVYSHWALGITFAMVALYVVATVWIYKRWVRKFLQSLEEPFFDRYVVTQYAFTWRLIIAGVFAANHYSFNNFWAVVQGLLQHRRNLFSYSSWLPRLLPHDVGLLLYSLAVRFRR